MDAILFLGVTAALLVIAFVFIRALPAAETNSVRPLQPGQAVFYKTARARIRVCVFEGYDNSGRALLKQAGVSVRRNPNRLISL